MENQAKKNPLLGFTGYVREAKEELEKVVWPSRRDTVRYTAIVIGAAVVLGAFFAGLDWVLTLGLERLIALKV